MSLFSKLFGGGDKPPAEPVRHEGFEIYPEPMAEDGGHRLCARIEKEVGGERKTHTMIRADVFSDRDQAIEASVAKAKAMIDQEGERIFGR